MPFVKDDPRINRVGPTLEDEVKLTKSNYEVKAYHAPS